MHTHQAYFWLFGKLSRVRKSCAFFVRQLRLAHFLIFKEDLLTTFDKIYVMEITNIYYVWFGEYEEKVYFGIEKDPVINSFPSSECIYLSLNSMGVYNEVMYVHFGDSIYKTDTKTLSASIVADKVYDVYFLEECIMAMKMKADRLDEMIKIVPSENAIISIGSMQKENLLR